MPVSRPVRITTCSDVAGASVGHPAPYSNADVAAEDNDGRFVGSNKLKAHLMRFPWIGLDKKTRKGKRHKPRSRREHQQNPVTTHQIQLNGTAIAFELDGRNHAFAPPNFLLFRALTNISWISLWTIRARFNSLYQKPVAVHSCLFSEWFNWPGRWIDRRTPGKSESTLKRIASYLLFLA